MNRKPNGAASTKNGNITMPKIHYNGLMNGYNQCHKENKVLRKQAANQCMVIKRLENKIKKLEKQASNAIHVESLQASNEILQQLLEETLNVQEKENGSRRHNLKEEKEQEIKFEDPPQCLGTDATRTRSKKRREPPPAYPDNRNGDDLLINDGEINREYQQWNDIAGHGIKQINYAQQRVMKILKCKMKDEGKRYLIYDTNGKERSCIQIIFECYELGIIDCREEVRLLKECVTLRNDMTHLGPVGYTKKEKQRMLDCVVDILIKLKR